MGIMLQGTLHSLPDMINQVKCMELCSLKKSILKGGLFAYDWVKKAKISPFPHRQRFQQLKDKGKYL